MMIKTHTTDIDLTRRFRNEWSVLEHTISDDGVVTTQTVKQGKALTARRAYIKANEARESLRGD